MHYTSMLIERLFLIVAICIVAHALVVHVAAVAIAAINRRADCQMTRLARGRAVLISIDVERRTEDDISLDTASGDAALKALAESLRIGPGNDPAGAPREHNRSRSVRSRRTSC